MLLDELREELKKSKSILETIDDFWNLAKCEPEYQRLSKLVKEEIFWQNPNQRDILKKFQRVRRQKKSYSELRATFNDLSDLIGLFCDDESELKKIQGDVTEFLKKIEKLKIDFLLSGPEDDSNCFLSVTAGAGGTESQDWSDMLVRMYLRFCEREGLKASLVDYQAGEEAGIKSATLFVKGKNAFGLLRGEHGIHRLVRISPFDAGKRRHTSFAAVFVMAETLEEDVIIDSKDLRIDTYRAGGAGGQHVNKTDSAVRITHIPTKIVVQCQNERSQLQNRETAMKMLRAKLKQKQGEEQKKKISSIEKKSIEWGSQIRSYVLHPYKMVKDHRTGLDFSNTDAVLDGDLMLFIEKNLLRLGAQK